MEVVDRAPTEKVTAVRAMSSRSGIGRRDTGELVVCMHTVLDIDPDEPENIAVLFALEYTQAAPQSWCLNNIAWLNM